MACHLPACRIAAHRHPRAAPRLGGAGIAASADRGGVAGARPCRSGLYRPDVRAHARCRRIPCRNRPGQSLAAAMAHWAYARPDLVRLLAASRRSLAALLDGGDAATRDKAWLLVATLGHYVEPVSRLELRPRPQRVRRAASLGEAYGRVLARYRALARQRRAPADDVRRFDWHWRTALARFAVAPIDARLNARLIAYLERSKYAPRTRARAHLAFRKIAAHTGVNIA